jgi:hypothetical protein
MRFEPLGLVDLLDLHGKYYDIRRFQAAGLALGLDGDGTSI